MTAQIPTPPDGEPAWADSINARREERKWADEDSLRGQKTANELWALKAIGIATAILIGFFLLIFIASSGAWIWHKVGPVYLHWLQDSQLADIQSVIFSGAIGAVVTSYAQQYLKKD